MRRGLASLILGLSLVVGSIAWAGFVMTRTILDPGRSERLSEQIFENEELRSVLASRLAASLGQALPGDVVVPTQTLEAAASLALDDPAIQELVERTIVDTHRDALEGDVQPVVIDSDVLDSALRSSLVTINPALEQALPAVPSASVELPTSGLNFLGTIRSFVETVTLGAAVIAAIGALTALFVTSDRPAVLRRVAFWAFGTALFWLILGFGIPALAGVIGPASSALATAVIDVFFGAMIPPALTMAGIGAAMLVASLVWDGVADRRPARVAQPERIRREPGPQNRAVRLGGTSGSRPAPLDQRAIPSDPADRTVVQSTSSFAHPGAVAPTGTPTSPDIPTVRPGPDAATIGRQAPEPPPADPAPLWIEGRGYVEPDEIDPATGRPYRESS